MKYNILQEKTFSFSLSIISLVKTLKSNKEFVLSDQIMRSGTSIGANVEESIGAISTKDFLAKLTIAYKEARETYYWLKLIKASDIANLQITDELINEVEQILKIIATIQIKTKAKLNSPRNS